MSFENYPALSECIWTKPVDYGGHNPEGEAVIATQNRDSDHLTQSNWDAMLKIAGGESRHVYIFRAHHWGVGWVEHMMLKPTAPDEIKDQVERALCALSDYPVLDDEDFSRREYEAIENYWGSDVRQRLDHIHDYNRHHKGDIPAFAARHEIGKIFSDYGDFYEHIRTLATE